MMALTISLYWVMNSNDNPPVIKLAQPGYDVATAGDENLIYSSLWPLLKTYAQGGYKTQDISVPNLIANHDLGFTPVFWYFANTPINSWLNSGAAGQARRSEYMGHVGDGSIQVDAASMKFVPNSPVFVSGPSQLYYYLFALDITKQYNAPSINVGSADQGTRPNRVFKVAKDGKDISSTDLFDFVIHSQARSPLIHSVNPSGGIVKSFVVEHDLTYLPIFFPFVKNDNGSYSPLYTGQGGSSSITSTENQIIFNDTAGKEITIVVLKDPFLIDASVQVTV